MKIGKYTDTTPRVVGNYWYKFHVGAAAELVTVYVGSEGKLRIAGTGSVEKKWGQIDRYLADTTVEEFGGFWSKEIKPVK